MHLGFLRAHLGPAILAATMLGGAHAQDSASIPVPTIRAESRVVQVDVVATDSTGKPVTGLSRADFSITDNGKPRAIDIFSASEPASSGNARATQAASRPSGVYSNLEPRASTISGHSTIIILDIANLNNQTALRDFDSAREGVIGLMGKIQPDERVAVYAVIRQVGLVLVHDYTFDHESVVRTLKAYIPPGLRNEGPAPLVSGASSGTNPPPANPTIATKRESAFQAEAGAENERLSLQTLAERLSLVSGRKSVFLVTTGFPPRLMAGQGQFAWDKTIAALNEANVAVNSIDPRGPQFPCSGGQNAAEQIATLTGGQSWCGRNDVDNELAQGVDASRIVYSLGFYLPEADRDGGFHSLRVNVGRPKIQLDYRQGYYAGSTPLSRKETEKKIDLESALIDQVDSIDVGITSRLDSVRDSSGKLTLRLNLNPRTLSLHESGGQLTGRIEELLVVLNPAGRTMARVSDKKAFSVAVAERPRFDREGITWSMAVPVAAGANRLVIAVRDSNTGRVGSLHIPLN